MEPNVVGVYADAKRSSSLGSREFLPRGKAQHLALSRTEAREGLDDEPVAVRWWGRRSLSQHTVEQEPASPTRPMVVRQVPSRDGKQP